MTRIETAFYITGKFEGKGYAAVGANFDGMGLSAGFLQWNLGSGTLQAKILKPFVTRHGSLDDLFPPRPISPVFAMTNAQAVEEAKRWHVDGLTAGRGAKLKPEWAAAWDDFMTRPEVIVIQQGAAQTYVTQAEAICKSYSLTTVRSFCWAFDVATQNWSMKGLPWPRPDRGVAKQIIETNGGVNKDLWLSQLPGVSAGRVSLLILSWHRAALSNWAADVFARKGTIVMETGTVHGTKYDFRDII